MPTCPEGHGDECPKARDGVDDEPVDQEADRQGEQGQEPEPEEQEELLVDNVVGENTNGLVIISLQTWEISFLILVTWVFCVLNPSPLL